MEMLLRSGDEVIALLNDRDFIDRWRALHAQCPWATAYQHPDYVGAWYRLYGRRYRPLLLYSVGEGRLAGLLALAQDREARALVGAGGPQAAYQVWLALPQCSDAFVRAALAQLQGRYPRRRLHLKHLAPGTPLDGLRDPDRALRCTLSPPEPRPFMRTGAERIRKSFNGKTNRNLYNRLKRLGEVRFEIVTEPVQMAAALDEYILQYDFRQAAMYDCAPFRSDPEKRAFHLKLLEAGLLHISVLKVGAAMVSVNVGLRGPDSVQVGITHSPHYADYSPGRLHTYLLCMALEKEGIACFDLTPGGGYKSLLATDTDEVVELSAFSALQTMRLRRQTQIMKLASSWLDRLGLSTTAARLAMARARKALQLLMSGTLPSAMRDQVCVYHGVPRAGGPVAASTLRANRLDDLLHYDETGGRQTYQAFQYEAMKRLESRQEVYTVVDGGRLAFCAWVGGRGEVPAPG